MSQNRAKQDRRVSTGAAVRWNVAAVFSTTWLVFSLSSSAAPLQQAEAIQEIRSLVAQSIYERADSLIAHWTGTTATQTLSTLDATELLLLDTESQIGKSPAASLPSERLLERLGTLRSAGRDTSARNRDSDEQNAQHAWSLSLQAQILFALDDANAATTIVDELAALELPSPLYADLLAANRFERAATLLESAGYFDEARLYRGASIELLLEAASDQNERLAEAYVLQGRLEERLGQLSDAWRSYHTARIQLRREYDTADPRVLECELLIAGLKLRSGDLRGAKSYYEGILATLLSSPKSPDSLIVTTRNQLATTALGLGEVDEARKLIESNLAGFATTLEAETQDPRLLPRATRGTVGSSLDADKTETLRNAAKLAEASGDLEGARRIYERILKNREEILEPDHMLVAQSKLDLARISYRLGLTAEAFEAAQFVEQSNRRFLREEVQAMSSRHALALSQQRVGGLDLLIQIAAETGSRVHAEGAWDQLVRSRTIVLDAIADRNRDLWRATELARLHERKQILLRRISNARHRVPSEVELASWRARKQRAEDELDRVEASIAENLALLTAPDRLADVGLPQITASLTEGDLLIAYASYADFESRRVYVGFVGTPDGSIELVSLGYSDEIDPLIQDWWSSASGVQSSPQAADSEAEYRQIANKVRAALWDPFVPFQEHSRRVIVVPEERIYFVNLGALTDETGAYLVEQERVIHYLSAERDLTDGTRSGDVGVGLLALGNPAFETEKVFQAAGEGQGRAGRTDDAKRDPAEVGGQCGQYLSTRFASLEYSEQEAEEVTSLYRGVAPAAFAPTKENAQALAEVLIGAAASERAFKVSAPGKEVLHLATHGFFLDGQCRSWLTDRRGMGRIVSDAEPEAVIDEGENPLALCGLALAGINSRNLAQTDEEDGVLTAEEIASLDLSGVRWAVLSACGTGLGEVTRGEGIFGLRRAFEIAGARTLITTLWSVNDLATRDWMVELYRARYEEGLTTARSLRAASLRVIESRRAKNRSTHPFYWAAFVASGDPE